VAYTQKFIFEKRAALYTYAEFFKYLMSENKDFQSLASQQSCLRQANKKFV